MSDLATADQVLLNAEPDLFLPVAGQPAIALLDGFGSPLAPAHAHVLKDGRVLLIGVAGNAGVFAATQLLRKLDRLGYEVKDIHDRGAAATA